MSGGIEGEFWRDVKGYEGHYKVSSRGRIKSLKWGKTRILSQEEHNSGYLRVKLCKDGKEKPFLVHRLVGLHFKNNPDNKKFINHKDGDKHNNYYRNIEWSTKSENTQHSFDTGLQKGLSGKDNPNASVVKQYDLEGNYIKTFNTIKQASKEVNGLTPNISKVCRGKRKTAYGYKWEYAD